MACLDEETNICVHESNGHGDSAAVRKDSTTISSTLLDETEDVIPSSTVKPRRMSPELEQNLLHMERSRESLNQHSSSDGSHWNSNVRLREVEDVVPETSFEIVLHFGEIEVGS